jgi:DNA methylase
MEAGAGLRLCVKCGSRAARQTNPHPTSCLHSSSVPRSQEALYAGIDLELSWSENELPQVERTKHVHALHPYLGKFVPQLVEIFLGRYFSPGACIYDPFAGSGTTLVEANVFGASAVGCDISAFNCLLSKVKTAHYSVAELELALRGTLEEARRNLHRKSRESSEWLSQWYSPRALNELLSYRRAADRLSSPYDEVARVILSRAARSARLTTHFDLDFPRTPTTRAYYCVKHKRQCKPVDEAWKFLSRYTTDTVRRLRQFALLRTKREVAVLHADAQAVVLPASPTGVITSPPYPGLIDYHEQHRYAYELLGLRDRRQEEIGPAAAGRSRAALTAYVEAMTKVFKNTSSQLASGAWVLIVVNDSQNLYPAILAGSDLRLEDRIRRHVNRRTGRRAGEFYEDVLVCRTG